MALINCPECGKEVSTLAAACPACGYPIAAPQSANLAECDYCKKLINRELTTCPFCNVQVFKSHRKQSSSDDLYPWIREVLRKPRNQAPIYPST